MLLSHRRYTKASADMCQTYKVAPTMTQSPAKVGRYTGILSYSRYLVDLVWLWFWRYTSIGGILKIYQYHGYH
jgi:hypothetical protein